MNCTKVRHAFDGHPQPSVLPVDLAMCLSLSQRRPLYQLLSMSPLKPTKHFCSSIECPPRTSLSSSHHSSLSSSSSSSPPSSPSPSERQSCFRKDGGGPNKKRVVFADSKGLALAAVRLFIPEPSFPTSTLENLPDKLQGQKLTSVKPQSYKLRLGFPQPSLDFKAFLARLQEMCVQLESCNITDCSLSGKVRVCHSSFEKAVHIRLTFDSWRSCHNIPCTYLQKQNYRGSDIDVFAFGITLPKNLDPKAQIEFCVSFRPGPGATTLWDNNKGQNYRVCMEKDGSNSDQEIAFHSYHAYSKHWPVSWPSHVPLSVKNSADLSSEKTIKGRTENLFLFHKSIQ
ncbi:hypothetical protein LDENG_00125330 [Lucifuga dentata]|nr:hypothetical protein LDENG_00125330 [Lucifuga dentata]